MHYISRQKCLDRVTAMELLLEKSKEYGFYGEFREEFDYKYTEFADNPYYRERTGAEEQKLIGFLMKSPALFYSYYRLLNGYRRLKQHKQEAGA